MLRVLTVSVLLIVSRALADGNDLETADAQADTAQAATRSAFERVDSGSTSELGNEFEFDESLRRSATLPSLSFPRLEAALTDPAKLATIGELFDDAETLAADLGMPAAAHERLSAYVFASFSMPEASLRALIDQGELADVPIVLRGLVNHSVEDTLQSVHALYKERAVQESGAVIDPTLFARFDIDQVPTVVVAEQAAPPCNPEACPTPAYLKIAGDVPLRYALDRIARAEPAYQAELRAMMKRLEPERQW